MKEPKVIGSIHFNRSDVSDVKAHLQAIAKSDDEAGFSEAELQKARQYLKQYSELKPRINKVTGHSLEWLLNGLQEAEKSLDEMPDIKLKCSPPESTHCLLREHSVTMEIQLIESGELVFGDPRVEKQEGWRDIDTAGTVISGTPPTALQAKSKESAGQGGALALFETLKKNYATFVAECRETAILERCNFKNQINDENLPLWIQWTEGKLTKEFSALPAALHVEALTMLGDLHLWSGDPVAAREYYAQAANEKRVTEVDKALDAKWQAVVLGKAESLAAPNDLKEFRRQLMQQGLVAFNRGKWDMAKTYFTNANNLTWKDALTTKYINKCDQKLKSSGNQ